MGEYSINSFCSLHSFSPKCNPVKIWTQYLLIWTEESSPQCYFVSEQFLCYHGNNAFQIPQIWKMYDSTLFSIIYANFMLLLWTISKLKPKNLSWWLIVSYHLKILDKIQDHTRCQNINANINAMTYFQEQWTEKS